MRSVELAVFADALAAEAAALHARLESTRARLRRAAIEREAREALPLEMAERLGRLGLLGADDAGDAAALEATCLDIAAVQRLQSWVESQLAAVVSGRPGARAEPAGPGPASAIESSSRLGEAA